MGTKTVEPTTKTKFKRLKKWENELNKCIRCGYCYELCPLYKAFNWESNAPRGKLVTLHGLLSDKFKPSQEISEKIFQCFYCNQCSDNCSAGVPITDIFTDARADFIDAGFDSEGTTTKVSEELCSACGMCISVCKSEALSFTEDDIGNRKVTVDRAKCEGCGLCVATCPSGVPSQKKGFGITPSELKTQISSFLKTNNTKIIVFACNWSLFPGLQLSESTTLINTTYGVIVTLCSGRVTPELILHSFKEGAWGVMVAGCPPNECEHDGNYRARKKILLFKDSLKQINIEPERIRMGWFSSRESAKLESAVADFANDLKKLGPIGETSKISYW